MEKRFERISFISFIIILLIICWYFIINKSSFNFWNEKNKSKEEIINNEIEKYNKWAEKIDYKTNMSGLVLENYLAVNNLFFTWWWLSIDSKIYSWEYLNVFNTAIKKDSEKVTFNYNIWNSLENNTNSWAINWTWSIQNWSWVISWWKSKNYELIFLKWFSKMKLLWKFYDYNSSNILDKSTYDLQLYVVKNKAFVIQFENTIENKSRKTKFEDYSKKIEEIKTKYWNDPYIANKLIKELNKSYNIEIDKLQ